MPLYWIISVAGHVPTGMKPEESAHKELQEELGFDTKLVEYTKMLLHYPNETHFAYGYLAKIPDGVEPIKNEDETEQLKFVNEAELNNMIREEERIEEFSLDDFRKFFRGEYDNLVRRL